MTHNPQAKRRYLLKEYGNGVEVVCALKLVCDGKTLTQATVTLDRIIPGLVGGRYSNANIQPACIDCNYARGVLTQYVHIFGMRHPLEVGKDDKFIGVKNVT